MNNIFGGISRWVTKLRSGLTLETLGFNLPPFTASFKVKHKRNRTTIITKFVQRTPVSTPSSPLDILWETVDTMTDAERKSAMKSRDWETAIVASLVLGYIRAQRRNKDGGLL